MKLNPLAVVFWIATGLICGGIWGLSAGLICAGVAMAFSFLLALLS